MDTLKATINSTLSTLAGVDVSQGAQTVFNSTPAVTFMVLNNRPQYDLDNDIVAQDAVIKVDIWGGTSTEASTTLAAAEEVLRGIGYHLSYTQDVPNATEDLFHITTRFTSVVV